MNSYYCIILEIFTILGKSKMLFEKIRTNIYVKIQLWTMPYWVFLSCCNEIFAIIFCFHFSIVFQFPHKTEKMHRFIWPITIYGKRQKKERSRLDLKPKKSVLYRKNCGLKKCAIWLLIFSTTKTLLLKFSSEICREGEQDWKSSVQDREAIF